MDNEIYYKCNNQNEFDFIKKYFSNYEYFDSTSKQYIVNEFPKIIYLNTRQKFFIELYYIENQFKYINAKYIIRKIKFKKING